VLNRRSLQEPIEPIEGIREVILRRFQTEHFN
jgi:hypothetical protein